MDRESTGHIQYSGASGFSTRCQLSDDGGQRSLQQRGCHSLSSPVTSRARSAAAIPRLAK